MSEEHRSHDSHSALKKVEECTSDLLVLGVLITLILLLGSPVIDGVFSARTSTVQVIVEK